MVRSTPRYRDCRHGRLLNLDPRRGDPRPAAHWPGHDGNGAGAGTQALRLLLAALGALAFLECSCTDLPAACMPAPSDRAAAFQSAVIYNLAAAGAGPKWNTRTGLPTLKGFAPLRAFAARRGLVIDSWLYDDGDAVPLEECEGRWRPAVAAIAFAPGVVASVAESAAAFDRHVRPLELAKRTRSKYVTHRLSVLTWAIWKGVLPGLLPMSDDLVRAFIWDCLAFEASTSVLKHALDAIKAWHRHLGLRVPLDAPGDYRRTVTSLARFQPAPRTFKFPIHKELVRRLLLLELPSHPACGGVIPPKPARPGWKRCPICWIFLHMWFDCLAGATGTLICSRCLELGQLQTCDIWRNFDFIFGAWALFRGGAAYNIKIRKNDQFRHGHQPRIGVPKDPRCDVLAQTHEACRLLGTLPRPDCSKRTDTAVPCPVCPPLFPRRFKSGADAEFDLSRPATSPEISAMIIRGLQHVGVNTTYFSGISARRGGLSTAIEAGVSEAILWMQSGHAQDVAARRYVELNSPALLYTTYESFDL